MSASAEIPRSGRTSLVSLLLATAIAALLAPSQAAATRPLVPAGAAPPSCPPAGPELRVEAPAKPVQAPSTVRIEARIGAAGTDACFEVPMRICARVGERARRDLRVRRECFRRGVGGAALSRKAVFMIRVKPRARGTYRVLLRAVPIRPAIAYRLLLGGPRATAKLRVRGD